LLGLEGLAVAGVDVDDGGGRILLAAAQIRQVVAGCGC
jgi:hypothetical protein